MYRLVIHGLVTRLQAEAILANAIEAYPITFRSTFEPVTATIEPDDVTTAERDPLIQYEPGVRVSLRKDTLPDHLGESEAEARALDGNR